MRMRIMQLSLARLLLSSLLFLSVSALVAQAAEKAPIYLWLEPETFDIKGGFGYWSGDAKPAGSWGLAGPGISPEWTQGESAQEYTQPRALPVQKNGQNNQIRVRVHPGDVQVVYLVTR